jgi:hypothetical protein
MKKSIGRTGDAAPPLGSRGVVRDSLANYNTAPDGAPPRTGAGTEILYGPGMIVELPLSQDTIMQAMVTVNDEDTAMPVLLRACRALGWAMVDLESGRTFG